MLRLRRSRAFTLVELLTVIAIVAVLASLLFSVLASSKARAKAAGCATNLSQLGRAVLLYGADFDDGLPPHLNFFESAGFVPSLNSAELWRTELLPYARDPRLFVCPDDPLAGRQAGAGFSRTDHRVTSFVHAEWLREHTDDDGFLNLSLTGVADTSSAAYLEEDPVDGQLLHDGQLMLRYPHGERRHRLFLDGHVKMETGPLPSVLSDTRP